MYSITINTVHEESGKMARPFTIAAVLFFVAWLLLAWFFHPDNMAKKPRAPPLAEQRTGSSLRREEPKAPAALAPTPVAVAVPAAVTASCDAFGSFGMTFGKRVHDSVNNADLVHCIAPPDVPQGGDRCNPMGGDTPCNQNRPLLCIKKSNLKRPDLDRKPPLCKHEADCGWSFGEIKLTPPLLGCAMTSPARADEICAEQAGPGFVMASFHDGKEDAGHGWGFYGQGDILPKDAPATRFWVKIRDQDGNCWNPRKA
jgi:hypothetical protein